MRARTVLSLIVPALVLPLALPTSLSAQSSPLVTDRPDFTESTASVAPGRVQLESGYTLTRADETDAHDLGEVLVRIGFAAPVELRLGANSYRVADADGGTTSGWTGPSVGAKVTLLEPAGGDLLVPSVALLAGTSLPAGHDELSPGGAEPEAALALGWDLPGRLSLGANLKRGRPLHEGERFGRTTASLAAGLSLTERLGAYLEAYTLRPSAPERGETDVLNGGLTLLLGPDVQLDARLGTGLGRGPDLVLGVGGSVRR